MLVELYGRNFGCFRDEFRLSLLATDIDRDNSRAIVQVVVEGDDTPLELLRCIAIYGPNASGKSTVLAAAHRLGQLIHQAGRMSSDERIPFEPFRLSSSQPQPVMLGAVAVVDGRIYDYTIEFDSHRVLLERLVHRGADSATPLVERVLQDVRGTWIESPAFQLIAKQFRANALLLSLADVLAPELAQGIAVGLRRLLHTPAPGRGPLGNAPMVASRASTSPAFRSWLLEDLQAADVGVIELETKARTGGYIGPHAPSAALTSDNQELVLIHRGSNGLGVRLPYQFESLGTQRLVALSPLLFDVSHADTPVAAFVDELDASLHSLLLREFVRKFNTQHLESKSFGQLIFTLHDTSLIDDEAKDAPLRRDQIYLTEKASDGAAQLKSLAEFHERNNLNLRRRYLQGRYGALPALGEFPA
ncbi:MAG: ATP-binding protein [Phycisphaerae bacterium]|nr:ATP-binding protein [Phycisphaerae bacterium]